jgi:hypothetical protein
MKAHRHEVPGIAVPEKKIVMPLGTQTVIQTVLNTMAYDLNCWAT